MFRKSYHCNEAGRLHVNLSCIHASIRTYNCSIIRIQGYVLHIALVGPLGYTLMIKPHLGEGFIRNLKKNCFKTFKNG